MRLRLPSGLAGLMLRPLVRLLAVTWRFEILGPDHWARVLASGTPYLLMCWHEALVPLLWRHRGKGVAIVVSQARDGQYLADFAVGIGYHLVRGSSHRGAVRALIGAVRELRAGRSVAFTPDGPSGPRRELKPGVVRAAQRGGGIIIPIHAEANRAWRLASWDRMLIPKPFARIRVVYEDPFRVGPGDDQMAAGVDQARQALAAAVRKAQWPEDGETPIG